MCKASLNLIGSDRVEHLEVADLVRADAACGDGRGDAVKRLNSTNAETADVELSI